LRSVAISHSFAFSASRRLEFGYKSIIPCTAFPSTLVSMLELPATTHTSLTPSRRTVTSKYSSFKKGKKKENDKYNKGQVQGVCLTQHWFEYLFSNRYMFRSYDHLQAERYLYVYISAEYGHKTETCGGY
jgi:hypothetical protein